MEKRFFIYGILGWNIEIICTGLWSLFTGDLRLVSRTYLWMFPIYGLAVLLEPVYHRIKKYPWFIRGIFWTILIFIIEYMAGTALKNMVGVYAWNYTGKALNVHGVIRLDYAPAWFALGLLFEHVYLFLLRKKIY